MSLMMNIYLCEPNAIAAQRCKPPYKRKTEWNASTSSVPHRLCAVGLTVLMCKCISRTLDSMIETL
jgi:hypothetical protein